jgi:hypothetical protein
MIHQLLFIRTSAGIISRDAVAFIEVGARNSIQVHLTGITKPVWLKEPEAAEFLKMLSPMVDVRKEAIA